MYEDNQSQQGDKLTIKTSIDVNTSLFHQYLLQLNEAFFQLFQNFIPNEHKGYAQPVSIRVHQLMKQMQSEYERALQYMQSIVDERDMDLSNEQDIINMRTKMREAEIKINELVSETAQNQIKNNTLQSKILSMGRKIKDLEKIKKKEGQKYQQLLQRIKLSDLKENRRISEIRDLNQDIYDARSQVYKIREEAQKQKQKMGNQFQRLYTQFEQQYNKLLKQNQSLEKLVKQNQQKQPEVIIKEVYVQKPEIRQVEKVIYVQKPIYIQPPRLPTQEVNQLKQQIYHLQQRNAQMEEMINKIDYSVTVHKDGQINLKNQLMILAQQCLKFQNTAMSAVQEKQLVKYELENIKLAFSNFKNHAQRQMSSINKSQGEIKAENKTIKDNYQPLENKYLALVREYSDIENKYSFLSRKMEELTRTYNQLNKQKEINEQKLQNQIKLLKFERQKESKQNQKLLIIQTAQKQRNLELENKIKQLNTQISKKAVIPTRSTREQDEKYIKVKNQLDKYVNNYSNLQIKLNEVEYSLKLEILEKNKLYQQLQTKKIKNQKDSSQLQIQAKKSNEKVNILQKNILHLTQKLQKMEQKKKQQAIQRKMEEIQYEKGISISFNNKMKKERQEYQKQYLNIASSLHIKEEELKKQKEKSNQLDQKNKQLQIEKESINKKLIENILEIETLKNTMKLKEQQNSEKLNRKASEIEQYQQKFKGNESKILDLQNKIIKLEQKAKVLKGSLDMYRHNDTYHKKARKQLQQKISEMDKYRQKYIEAEGLLKENEEQLSDANKQIEDLQKKLENDEHHISELMRQIEVKTQQNIQLTHRLAQIQSQYDLLYDEANQLKKQLKEKQQQIIQQPVYIEEKTIQKQVQYIKKIQELQDTISVLQQKLKQLPPHSQNSRFGDQFTIRRWVKNGIQTIRQIFRRSNSQKWIATTRGIQYQQGTYPLIKKWLDSLPPFNKLTQKLAKQLNRKTLAINIMGLVDFYKGNYYFGLRQFCAKQGVNHRILTRRGVNIKYQLKDQFMAGIQSLFNVKMIQNI